MKGHRPALWAASAAALAAGSLTPAAMATSPGPAARDFFPVPPAALARPLGEVPPGPCAPPPSSQACQGAGAPESSSDFNGPLGAWPLSVPGLGIPLGGVGAGAFMVNQDGTFGPWNFGNEGSWETRILPQAAFHVREQVGAAPAMVRTLATDGPDTNGIFGHVPQRSWGSPLPAWHALQPGQGTYSTLYPFGWMSYTPFQADVSMRFFSPIVAGEDRRTSLPVAYFDVRLANHTNQTDNLSVMLTMPNAPDHVAGTCSDPNSCSPASVRQGLGSSYQSDPSTGVDAVDLTADGPGNTPDAAHSEWTIATRPDTGQDVSYTTSWKADGDGSDVYAPFTASGALPDQALDSSASAGALSVSVQLAPGQVTTVPFVLAWDFPQVNFSNTGMASAGSYSNPLYMRRYTDFYGAQESSTNHYIPGSYPFHQGFAIARDALVGHDGTVAAVQRWWDPIAYDPAYPLLLRTAALDQLYQVVMNSSFWDGGLVAPESTPGPDDTRPGTHLFQSTDNGGGCCGSYSSWDVDSYGWLGYDRLFPNLERDRLLVAADSTVAAGPSTATPGDTEFLDDPAKQIYRWYGYAKLTGDGGFLDAVYPAMKLRLAYIQGAIPQGTYLPVDAFPFTNTYDVVVQTGPGLYDSELYMLGLESTIAAGQQLGDGAGYLASLRNDLAHARAQFETLFWDPVNGWYRWTTAGPNAAAVGLDSFFAQHIAEVLGLGDVVDPAHYRSQLASTYRMFADHHDAQGRPLGAPNIMQPGSVELPNRYLPVENSEVWTGTNYSAAADYYLAGKRFGDPQLEQEGIALGSAVAAQIWAYGSNGFAFDPPESWVDNTTSVYRYPAYTRAFAVWTLIDAIKPVSIPS